MREGRVGEGIPREQRIVRREDSVLAGHESWLRREGLKVIFETSKEVAAFVALGSSVEAPINRTIHGLSEGDLMEFEYGSEATAQTVFDQINHRASLNQYGQST